MSVGWGIIGIGKVADIAIAPAINADEHSSLAAVCSRNLDRLDVFGTAGWLDARGGTSPAPDDILNLHTDDGTGRLATSTSSAYDAEVADFSDGVASGSQPTASGLDGLRAVAVADALYRSAEERRGVAVEV